jgi:uncharacterized protein YbaP (TraB family)
VVLVRWLVLAIVLDACASHHACTLPPVGHGAPLLWRVQRAGGPVLWLYGTIHDAGADRVPATAWHALESSSRFASELGDVEPDPADLRELARLPFGQVLDAQLGRDDWWDLVEAMRGALSADDLRHARPWFAMTRLTERVAPSPRPSMDVALAERARDKGIAVDALESWRDQLAALATSVTAADLAEAIHARHEMACDIDKLRAAYDAGDLVALEARLRPRAAQQLLVARNGRWQPRLEQYLASGGAFVAVGLGHLLGSDGLLATLASAGYTVERMPADILSH